jgi:hypothetical protein
LMMVLMLVVGWSYNLGLKSTGFSLVPYAIGFGILPVFVTLSFQQPQLLATSQWHRRNHWSKWSWKVDTVQPSHR